MNVSEQGLAFLAAEEGIVPAPYLDSVGVWTWGIGHTLAAGDPDPEFMPRGMPLDMAAELRRVVEVFRRDVARYAADVAAAVERPLSQHEFDALVSWHYNTGAVRRATLIGLLNKGDYIGAGEGLLSWRMAGGKPNAGLQARRERERRLFLAGDYQPRPIAVWTAGSDGRLGKLLRSMPWDEFMALPRSATDSPAQPQELVRGGGQPESGGGLLVALLRALAWVLAMLKGGKP